jgi:hypothetical protein
VTVRAMLARVRRLEATRAPLSPFELAFRTLDAWAAECQVGIAAGLLDASDVPVVVMAVRRWHRDGAWARRGISTRGG